MGGFCAIMHSSDAHYGYGRRSLSCLLSSPKCTAQFSQRQQDFHLAVQDLLAGEPAPYPETGTDGTERSACSCEVLERQETAEQVRWALSKLPAMDREILALRYLEELKTTELAQRLEIPTGTVKARIHRALARLKALLEKNHDE